MDFEQDGERPVDKDIIKPPERIFRSGGFQDPAILFTLESAGNSVSRMAT
jgi:hypothetical protein